MNEIASPRFSGGSAGVVRAFLVTLALLSICSSPASADGLSPRGWSYGFLRIPTESLTGGNSPDIVLRINKPPTSARGGTASCAPHVVWWLARDVGAQGEQTDDRFAFMKWVDFANHVVYSDGSIGGDVPPRFIVDSKDLHNLRIEYVAECVTGFARPDCIRRLDADTSGGPLTDEGCGVGIDRHASGMTRGTIRIPGIPDRYRWSPRFVGPGQTRWTVWDIDWELVAAYSIDIAVNQIKVHDDCDNVSPGDHIYVIDGGLFRGDTLHAGRLPLIPFVQLYPHSGSINASSGETLHPGIRVQLPHVPDDTTLRFGMLGVDCDGDRAAGAVAALIGGHFDPFVFNTLGLFDSPDPSDLSCGTTEEEIFEVSGSDDDLGFFRFATYLADLQSDHAETFLEPSGGSSDCDNPAFTATVSLKKTPE